MTAGRPTEYNQELIDNICSQLAEGVSLRTICQGEGMPDKSTVFRWLRLHKEFQDQYARAKEESTDAMSEDILSIADESLDEASTGDAKRSNAKVQAQRLRVDTRKWIMSKMKPKKYGDKLDMTTDGKAIEVNLISYKKNTDIEPKA
jgi:hypothetical protein